MRHINERRTQLSYIYAIEEKRHTELDHSILLYIITDLSRAFDGEIELDFEAGM